MADNRGQAKPHQVQRPDGTIVTMTQEEWRNRDKALGLVRLDEDGNAVPDDQADADTGGTTTTPTEG